MEISYYELIGMIKENNIPEIVEYNGIQYKADYDIDDSFLDYLIVDKKKINDSVHFYLGENILLSEMFTKNLLIPKEKENNNIEKLDFNRIDFTYGYGGGLMEIETADIIMEIKCKINEMIDRMKDNDNTNR